MSSQQNLLEKALNQLDTDLQIKGLRLDILIGGAYAIYLHGFTNSTHTLDVDSFSKINSQQVCESIRSRSVNLYAA